MPGTLYLVATPIGNLEDITLRALRVLGEVDLIACEDTRHTRKLLAHYEISKPMVSYHEHNERERTPELVEKLKAGTNIALVSDAGTPLVSDPGFRLVRDSIGQGVRVVPIPGPSALVAALAGSGLATGEFIFAGFLPARRAARRARLAELAGLKSTLIFYEAPHRIKETIRDAREALGDRPSVVARELTKLHEEFIRGPLSEIEIPQARGEIVLLIGPPLDDMTGEAQARETRPILEEIEAAMRDEGLDRKSALKRVARARRISKSEAYRLALQEAGERELE
ncbi:MAG TPA: 16S rRNA (cytidine(1402)-2'-O)-methyltransferase [Blastocatellia bacterium]|nr:16S rRNA (cytidine(1402)-2'-O)-methyltransferase [Blastocatellia bacterium]